MCLPSAEEHTAKVEEQLRPWSGMHLLLMESDIIQSKRIEIYLVEDEVPREELNHSYSSVRPLSCT